MRRKKVENKQNTDRWLTTYADMMNNLLVLFMVLYAMSVLDLKKFQNIAQEFSKAFSGNPVIVSSAVDDGDFSSSDILSSLPAVVSSSSAGEPNQFDQAYERLKAEVAKQGYADSITLEKGQNYIKFLFGDTILFYPDSPQMKPGASDILFGIGNILKGVDDITQTIEIGGHTAQVGNSNIDDMFSWGLSCDRAFAVLKVLVQQSGLPESKMSATGYSHFKPVATNETEEGRSKNRRVEIKITRVASGG